MRAYSPNSHDILSVILGGGEGKRLFPLTKDRSKPAVPLAGKYRLVDIPVSNCINSGYRRIFVLTQYNSASLNRHVMQSFKFDHLSQDFVEILAAEIRYGNQQWFLGTADAVRQNLMHFHNHSFKYYLILAGDQLYRMDFRKVISQHVRARAEITVAAARVASDQSPNFGILSIDENKHIKSFHEKPNNPAIIESLALSSQFLKASKLDPSEGKTHLASMGIYVFNADVLDEILKNKSMMDFGKDVIPASLGKRDVQAYLFDGYWEDIGTIKTFYEANINLTTASPSFDFFSFQDPVFTRPRLLSPSRILNCEIKNALIAEGSFITASAITNSIVGIRSTINGGTKIERSVLMGNDYYEKADAQTKSRIPLGIGKNCIIKNAIVDKNAHIGNKVTIINKHNRTEFDGIGYYIRDGIVIIEKNALIKSGTVI